MRITGGVARGVPLIVPKGEAVRPATDAMRQSVFSSVASWIPDATFLDLFAGSGAYGLEAVSRGAAKGIFVEKDARTAACIHENVAAVCKSAGRSSDGIQIVNADATAVSFGLVPDLVFIDPPYPIISEVAPQLFVGLTELLAEKTDPSWYLKCPANSRFPHRVGRA